MEKILYNCNKIYNRLNCCHDDGRTCNCSSCLNDGFYGGSDTYTCIKKLCYYAMRYGTVYINEIYYFLLHTRILERFFNNELRVISLGCGFGPDFIALIKYNNDIKAGIKLKYWGYDKEVRWKKIISDIYTNLPHEKDLMQGFSLANSDIIFLNKIFSTLKSIGQHEKFAELLVASIQNSMEKGALIVFNDVNHFSMGRDYFHSKIVNFTELVGKYYYNVDGAYGGDYEEIPFLTNVCTVPADMPVSPYRIVNKTVFFVYRKI